MTFACKDCRFFEKQYRECRRRAPKMDYPKKMWIDIHDSELLRDIAWSLRVMAGIKTPAREDDLDDLNQESTELDDALWPRVELDDWCGEFET